MVVTILNRLSLKKTLIFSIFICLGYILYTENEVLFNNTLAIHTTQKPKNKDNEHYENIVSSFHYIANIKMLL